MKRYKYEEWGILDGTEYGGFDERIYVDSNDQPITGILEGFYGYTADTTDEKNCQYIKNGKRKRV
jgi:hypothetical protein